MITFPTPPSPDLADRPPRCLDCGYILERLERPRCPECGREFDPDRPLTYTRHPGFVFWKYWLPGFCVSVGGGSLVAFLFLLNNSVGWGLTLGVPFAVGSLLGYGTRLRVRWLILLGLLSIVFVVVSVRFLDVAGPLCGCILAGLFLLPTSFGVGVGCAVRGVLKSSKFSQRWYLPVLLFLLIPVAVHAVERSLNLEVPPEEYATTVTMSVPLERAWSARLFDRPRDREPVGLMRVGLPPPSDLEGEHTRVGAVKRVTYGKGRLRVLVTECVDGRLLAFRFIGQSHVEDRAVRLLDSRWAFEPAGATSTRVTITTRYQPLMTPRWYWRPAERMSGEDAHQYILAELRRSAEESRP